ncbi:Retrovirus-related Pol polyprotein from transposon RE1, partial [Linum grandiflorum]
LIWYLEPNCFNKLFILPSLLLVLFFPAVITHPSRIISIMSLDANSNNSNNSTTTITTPPADNNLVTINPVANLPLKLTSSNFPSWRSQVETLLMGLDLLGFLDGTSAAPARTITQEGVAVPNPSFVHWFRQDKLILHALRCSVSESIYTYVTAAKSTHEAWNILEKLYASKSKSRVMNLKDKMTREKQGDRDVATYLHAMKTIAAELALVEAPVHDDDLVVHCLRGLAPEYRQISAAIRARGTSITVEELLDLLVEYEADLKHQTPTDSVVPTTFYTQQRGRSTASRGGSRGRGGGAYSHKGGKPSRPSSSNLLGHHNYSIPSPSNGSFGRPFYGPHTNTHARPPLVCQICEKTGHSAQTCRNLFSAHQQQAQINYTAHPSSSTQQAPSHSGTWLMDSAASHHVTADLGNLSIYSDYNGPDEIMIGDGTGSQHGGATSEGKE